MTVKTVFCIPNHTFEMRFINRIIIFLCIVVLVTARGNRRNGPRRPTGDEYALDPNIYELNPSNFDRVIHKTNYTSIVKFYAPWCGYCQKLKPAWKKLGKLVQTDGKYAVNVASVNCDKESNKALCNKYKVTGFPSLMVFRPPKYDSNSKSKNYRHTIEPYNGERSLKAMYSYVTSGIKNYVKKFPTINSDGLKTWARDNEDYKKVLLITESQVLSPLYKSLAIDFITTIKFGMTTIKSLKGVKAPSVTIGGHELSIPISDADKLPLLLTYDESAKSFVKYDKSDKLNDKLGISQWLVDIHGVSPLEGELSKKDKKYNANYRIGEKVKKENKNIEHDEL